MLLILLRNELHLVPVVLRLLSSCSSLPQPLVHALLSAANSVCTLRDPQEVLREMLDSAHMVFRRESPEEVRQLYMSVQKHR